MKLLIADDHALFREGMRHVLRSLGESVVVMEASNSDSAIRAVKEHPDMDLVLLDLNMPGKDGFSALELFSRHYPALPVVILSASTRRSDMQRALDMGAMGFIPKESTGSVVINALRLVMSGSIYVPPALAGMGSPDSFHSEKRNAELTARQLEVLQFMVEGRSNKDIARHMNLAEATVKMHVTAILKALNADNRTQAVVVADRLGLVNKDQY